MVAWLSVNDTYKLMNKKSQNDETYSPFLNDKATHLLNIN